MLQQTSKNIKEVAPEIAKQLNELRTAKIKIDLNTDKLEEFLENHKQELKKLVIIPKWFLVLIAVVIFWLIIQNIFNL